MDIEEVGKEIVDIAFQLHRKLGPGLLESVYEVCFCYELEKRGIPFIRQKRVPIVYNGVVLSEGLRIDILVDDKIIIELKAQDYFHPVWQAQLLSYLKLSDKRLGYLINFNVTLIKQGIRRMINSLPE